MDSHHIEIKVSNPGELRELIRNLPPPQPGDECERCHRPVPKVRSDAQAGPRRETISISVPKGEEGVLEGLWIDVIDKYREQWPREYAAMRADVGLELVGGRSWKYHTAHFCAYAVLMVPGLAPVEEG